MADEKRVFQCFQRKILQNQQTSYSGVFKVFKVFNEEFNIDFGILYGKIAEIKTYFSWFSLKQPIFLKIRSTILKFANLNSFLESAPPKTPIRGFR